MQRGFAGIDIDKKTDRIPIKSDGAIRIMEGDNADAQAAFNADETSQPPPIDNIHSEHQTMDTGVPYHNAVPPQANVRPQFAI